MRIVESPCVNANEMNAVNLCIALAIITVTIISFAESKVPSYIEVCGRRNPKLDECVEQSVRKLTPRLQSGIPELDVPPIEPLTIDRIVLADRQDFQAIATDIKLSGLSDFAIQHMQLDLENHRIDFQVLFNRIFMKANYDVKAKILVPIAERGPLDIVTGQIIAKVTLRFKIVERGTRRLIYFPSMTASLDIVDYTVNTVPNDDHQDQTLAKVIYSVLTNSRRDIIKKLTPDLEKAISAKVLEMANKICKHFTFDELFPDRP